MTIDNLYPEFRIPVKVYYDEKDQSIYLKVNSEIEISKCDIDGFNEENLIKNKIDEILNDPDPSLTLVVGIDINGNIVFYDSSKVQTELYETEISRELIEANKDRMDIILSHIKNKLKEGLIKIESRLIIPILDN